MKIPTLLTVLALFSGLNAASTDFDNEALTALNNESSIYDVNYSRRFIPYVKLGPEMTNIGKQNTVMPGFGVGIRSESPTSAVDCSFSYATVETKNDEQIFHYFTPKLLYLKYLNSHSPSAIFLGFGSAWAGIENDSSNESFHGLAGVISAGIEYNRSSRIRQIYQIDIHEPLLGLTPMDSIMMPIVEMSFSLGF